MMREPAWRRQGEEPDYRFSLANERTFLAWMRTALAVLGGGVLLDQFAGHLAPRWPVAVLAALMCLSATSLCLLAWRRWRDNEIAMRHKRALPWSPVLAGLCGVMVAAGIALAVMLLAGGLHAA